MVATGNKPPYGVRHLPEKSKGVFAPILLGSKYDFREPCGTGGLRVCLERFITIWVTPGNGSRSCYFAAKLFYNSIFRVSKWFFFFTHSRSPQNLCIRQVVTLSTGQAPSIEGDYRAPREIESEPQYRSRQNFALRSESAADMNNATPAANENHLGVRKNRQPFSLDLEAEMATGIEPDSAPDSKRETREVDICTTGNMGGTHAGQYERL